MFYNIKMERVVEKGSFRFMVGGSSSDADLIFSDIYISKDYKF